MILSDSTVEKQFINWQVFVKSNLPCSYSDAHTFIIVEMADHASKIGYHFCQWTMVDMDLFGFWLPGKAG